MKAKLIRYNMNNVGPTPKNYVTEEITDTALIRVLLIAKLHEETEEISEEQENPELLFELADAYEVVKSLGALHGVTMEQIVQAADDKAAYRGTFLEGEFPYFSAILLKKYV